MSSIDRPLGLSRPDDFAQAGRLPPAGLLALALMVPMIVSGVIFRTYDITMATLPMEMFRQFNFPFVLAEMVVIVAAAPGGFRVRDAVVRLDRPARWALAIFLVTFWIGGVFISRVPAFATPFNVIYLIHAIFLAAVLDLSRRWSADDTATFTRLAFVALLGFAVMIAISFLMPPPGRAVDTIRWQFAIPGFISLRLFGALVAPFAVLMLYLAVARGTERAYRGWIYAACALTVGMIVWSGTRAAVLGVAVSGVIALFWYRPPWTARTLTATTGAIAAGTVLALMLLPYGDPDFHLFLTSDFLGGTRTMASGRVELWLASLEAYRTVIPFGAGPGASAWIIPPELGTQIQPHNLLVSFLLNWGIFATAAALYLLVRVVVAAHRHARRAAGAVPFVLAADCLLVIGFFDGTFHFAQHLMVWMAMTGVSLAMPLDDGGEPEPEAQGRITPA